MYCLNYIVHGLASNIDLEDLLLKPFFIFSLLADETYLANGRKSEQSWLQLAPIHQELCLESWSAQAIVFSLKWLEILYLGHVL